MFSKSSLVGATIYGLNRKKTIRESLLLGLKAARFSLATSDTIPANLSQIL